MNPYNILVSGASGIVGYGVLRSLKNCGCKLIGTTIYKTSPANCFADVVLQPPMTTDASYIPWLVKTIKQYKIDMIIPAIEADMSCWNKHRKVLADTGTFVMLNNPQLIELCLDKWKFYQKLKENNFPYAIESSLNAQFDRFSLPFLLKPRCGFASKGIVKVESREVFEKYKSEIGPTLMMQEFVGTSDEEYTASGFFDNAHRLMAFIVMKRTLSKQGFTEMAQSVAMPELKGILEQLGQIFQPVGPTNFQFRRHKNSWKLLEINPRISSSTSLKTAFGYNECKMAVDYFLSKKSVTQPPIKAARAIRYTEDYIFYEKDSADI